LKIDKGVNVSTDNGTVIAVLEAKGVQSGSSYVLNTSCPLYYASGTDATTAAANCPTYYTTFDGKDKGFAFGVKVEVEGKLSSEGGTKCYGIKTNGNLQYPGDTTLQKAAYPATYINKQGLLSDEAKANVPYVYVGENAQVISDANYLKSGSTAVYCSGYANWVIEGKCEGATGVFVSSGDVDIQGEAVITSTATEYHSGEAGGHAKGSGSAIVINSRDAYAGEVALDISGDVTVTASTGYAIDEVVNTKTDTETGKQTSKVENITISGGTFTGGSQAGEDKPAIVISPVTAGTETAEVVVLGGNVVNGAQVGEEGGIEAITPSTVHTTTVVVDGKEVTVISEGSAPDPANSVIAADANSSIKWQNSTTKEETLNKDLVLAELEINENYAQKLTIAEGKTLKVGRIILGPNAQIVVNAGAKLIVDGEQGFVASSPNNFLLKTEEGNPAIFLFHPSVTSNRHPKATVEFVSRSFRVNSSNYAFQRFGIPTIAGELESISAKYNNADVQTAFMAYDYAADDWANIGYINTPGKTPLDITKLSNPFEYYQMQNNNPEMGTVVTMTGKLVGNEIPNVTVREGIWNGYANSCTALMSMRNVITTAGEAIYLNNIQAHQKVWESKTLLDLISGDQYIHPLQPFLLKKNAADELHIDYADAVYYTPAGSGESKPSQAPARNHEFSEITIASMIVNGENGYDRLIVAEDAQFSSEFDNGYDAVKYMNDGINMYVSANEKMSSFATDNLENTYVGIDANGTYTIEFANVMGEELTLIDHETGARVAMVEGGVYEFTANGTNDYRFEIVKSANAPTAIENTEAVKSAKGIYTITGQYMGEMSVWNTLPAGVYVVNGEKLVK
jgi:hypothetical protein